MTSSWENARTDIMVKNLIFNNYFMNALRALRCLILFTAEDAKVAKISLKRLVFNYTQRKRLQTLKGRELLTP